MSDDVRIFILYPEAESWRLFVVVLAVSWDITQLTNMWRPLSETTAHHPADGERQGVSRAGADPNTKELLSGDVNRWRAASMDLLKVSFVVSEDYEWKPTEPVR